MSSDTPSKGPTSVGTRVAYEQEVRFAVVMYGGVSLAIYINGIAQELLCLVRATAPASDNSSLALLPTSELSGTERVYRKLGQLLGPELEWLTLEQLVPDAPIRSRFVIDVLSGTSAGGINAVFLARALANGQSLSKLKELWRTQADIHTLLNDDQSVQGDRTLRTPTPLSLLNSRRMYRLLLDALEGMGEEKFGTPAKPSPLVDDLDLYVTTTDVRGVPVSLRLSESVVNELRHRHVFHFHYASEAAFGRHINDFEGGNERFLAFAARCTSAFPFAFEPVALSDLQPILYPGDTKGFEAATARWERFFHVHLLPGSEDGRVLDQESANFRQRTYSDGGLLDNKPFTYATQAIFQRRSRRLVNRRLLYLEPVTDHPKREPGVDEKPDAFEMALRALFVIRGYESIRGDLENVLERNWQLRQLSRVQAGVERDIQKRRLAVKPAPGPSDDSKSGTADVWSVEAADSFAGKSVDTLVGELGVSYGAYHRLKLDVLIEDLASIVCCTAGFDPSGAESKAIHLLVDQWVSRHYTPSGAKGTKLETRFVLDFDLSFRIRRLLFVRRLIRDLLRLNERSIELLELSGNAVPVEELLQADPDGRLGFRVMLESIGDGVERIYVSLCALNRLLHLPLQAPWDDIPLLEKPPLQIRDLKGTIQGFRDAVTATGLNSAGLLQLFSSNSREQEDSRAALTSLDPKVQAVADTLAAILRSAFHAASEAAREELTPVEGSSKVAHAARSCLEYFYAQFDQYDLITFGMRYGTDLWAADRVNITRISPEDAPALIDESVPHGRRKLAGNRLGNFAAFVDELWRRNDMLWGRLDAAERLVRSLLPPDHPDFEALRDEAIGAVLAEELEPSDRDELGRLLTSALLRSGGSPTARDLEKLLQDEFGNPVDSRVKALLRLGLSQAGLVNYFRNSYEVDRGTPAPRAVSALSRAVRIMGRMLESAADRAGANAKPLGWIARLGRASWWFVEIATPGTLVGFGAGHLWALLTLIALVLYVMGGVSGNNGVAETGLKALTALGTLFVLWLLLRTFLASQLSIMRKLGLALGVALALFGLWSSARALSQAFGWLPSWALSDSFNLGFAVALLALVVAVERSIYRAIRTERARKAENPKVRRESP